jgi:hypothetical protein
MLPHNPPPAIDLSTLACRYVPCEALVPGLGFCDVT